MTSAGARAGISHTSRGQRKGGRASPVGRRRVRGDGDAAHHRADIRGRPSSASPTMASKRSRSTSTMRSLSGRRHRPRQTRSMRGAWECRVRHPRRGAPQSPTNASRVRTRARWSHPRLTEAEQRSVPKARYVPRVTTWSPYRSLCRSSSIT